MREKPSYHELEQRIRELEDRVSEVRVTETAVENREGLFNPLFEKHSAIMLLIEPDSGAIIDANIAAQTYYGYSINTLKQMKIQDINIRLRDEIAEKRRQAAAEKVNCFEFPHRLSSGEIRTVEVHSSPVILNGKKVLLSIIHDITERKRIQETVEKERRLLRKAEQLSDLGAWEWDIVNDRFSASENWQRLHGISNTQMSLSELFTLAHPEDVPRIEERSRKVLAKEIPIYDLDHRIIRKNDGQVRYVHALGEIVFDNDDTPIWMYGTTQDITERKLAQEKLKAAEAKLKSTFDISPSIISKVDIATGYFIEASPVTTRILGFSVEEFTSRPIMDFIHPEDRQRTMDETSEQLNGKEVTNFENRYLCKDGSYKWMAWQGTPADKNGIVTAIGSDITERKCIEETLRENEEKYRTLFERESDAIFIYDPDSTCILDANAATSNMYGYSHDELIGMSCLKFSAEANESASAIEKIHENGEKKFYDRLHRKKDGTVFPVDISSYAITLKGKKMMYAVSTDVTLRKQTEDKLLKNQYYLTKAQEMGKIGTWELDIRQNILIWTDENYKIFGVPLGTPLTYEIFLDSIHPDDRDYVHQKWRAALKNEAYDIMHRIVVDNTVKWVREKADIQFDGQGNAEIAIGFTQDLTDFKEIEKALQESEEKFKVMFERAPLSYQSLDENGNFTEVNQTWLQTMGYQKEDVLGKNFSEFLVPEWKRHFLENFPRFKAVGEVLGVEFEMIKKDGSVILVSFHGKIGKNADGTFKQTHCIFHDVTQQRNFERQKEVMAQKMTQMQKIESIGNLAGGIAHDFNNILFPIMGMSEMLMEDLPEDSQEYESAKEIFMAGKRGSELVKQILSFSRQHEHKLIPVRIEKIIKEVVKLSRSTIPSDIVITDSIQQGCGFVMADPTQIHQVAMNLITNAFHAVEKTGHKGRIDIEFTEIDRDNEEIPDSLMQLGRYARLSISDNGVGMTQNIMNQIFEPYFTTKAKGKGTGLGLAVAHGIVKEHKGDIKVKSETGKGTTFSVYLPLMKKAAEGGAQDPILEIQTGSERILLVDDEASIIRLEKQILERLGYKVTDYSNSRDALAEFKINPEKYDLVITDMTMPDMTGDRLAREILSIKPGTPIMICTGFSDRINQEQAKKIGVKGFLMKPVVKSEMAQIVRKILDGHKVS